MSARLKRWHRDPTLAMRLIGKARARQSKAPLARQQLLDLAIGYHGALESLRTGGREADAHTLAMASNVALMLCELGIGGEYIDGVKRAQDAIVAMLARAAKGGRYGFDGPGLAAVQAMLELHDAQLESPDCTEGLLLAALAEIRKRMAAGQVLEGGERAAA